MPAVSPYGPDLPMPLHAADAGLKRELTQLGYAAITLNGVIGGGLFALPALAAASAGSFSPWLFLLAGALFMTIVQCFARLSALFPQTGGPSVYVAAVFGPWFGFQTGWLLYLGRVTATAANANLLLTYLAWFRPEFALAPLRTLGLIVVIAGLTLANYRGLRQGMALLWLLTALKLVPLALLLLLGLRHLSPALLIQAELPPLLTVGETVLLLFYAFVGFESGAINAGEGRQPQRDIPRALLRTVLLTALLYFLIQWLAVSALPGLASSAQPLAALAEIVLGPWGAALIAFTAIASIFGNLASAVMTAPRMSFALARDRCLPGWLAEIHPRFATPGHSILAFGALGLVLAVSNTFVYLAIMSTLVRLVGYALCAASLPVLARRRAALPWTAWLSPLSALGLCVGLMGFAAAPAWWLLLGFVLIGSLLLGWTRRR